SQSAKVAVPSAPAWLPRSTPELIADARVAALAALVYKVQAGHACLHIRQAAGSNKRSKHIRQ
ncbi:MAG: hypothetical protein ACI4NW_11000, partial [Stenotrophomonas sp.]